MLDGASGYHGDVVPGRWVVQTRLKRADWEVVVEPDEDPQVLVMITAYPK